LHRDCRDIENLDVASRIAVADFFKNPAIPKTIERSGIMV